MKQFLRHIAGYLYPFYMELKGGRRLANYSREEKHIGELAVTSIQGFRIEIHCRELRYDHHFTNPLFKKKTFVLYSLYGEVTGSQAPERLTAILSRKSIVPSVLPSYVPWATTRKYVVEAYLDMVLSLLQDTPRCIVGEHDVDTTVYADPATHR